MCIKHQHNLFHPMSLNIGRYFENEFWTETGCGGGKSGKRGLFKVLKTYSRD